MLRLLHIDMKNEAGRDPDMGIIYKEIEAMLLEFEIIKINSEKNCFGYIYQNNRVFYLNFIFFVYMITLTEQEK